MLTLKALWYAVKNILFESWIPCHIKLERLSLPDSSILAKEQGDQKIWKNAQFFEK
jgi:hypothetical protein